MLVLWSDINHASIDAPDGWPRFQPTIQPVVKSMPGYAALCALAIQIFFQGNLAVPRQDRVWIFMGAGAHSSVCFNRATICSRVTLGARIWNRSQNLSGSLS